MPTSTRRRRVAVYLVVVLALGLMLARTESQDAQIRQLVHEQRLTEFRGCQARLENVEATRRLREQLSAVERPEVARIYQHTPLLTPHCGPVPR